MREWICTKCSWKGEYQDTMPVMYHGVDWQNCPSCKSVAIPIHQIDLQPEDSADHFDDNICGCKDAGCESICMIHGRKNG